MVGNSVQVLGHADIIHRDGPRVFDLNHAYPRGGRGDRGQYREAARAIKPRRSARLSRLSGDRDAQQVTPMLALKAASSPPS